jgi:hypothetical protein
MCAATCHGLLSDMEINVGLHTEWSKSHKSHTIAKLLTQKQSAAVLKGFHEPDVSVVFKHSVIEFVPLFGHCILLRGNLEESIGDDMQGWRLIFWNVTPYSMVTYQSFGGNARPFILSSKSKPSKQYEANSTQCELHVAHLSILKMEAVHPFKTLVNI